MTDLRPSLSESARAALLADPAVSAAHEAVQAEVIAYADAAMRGSQEVLAISVRGTDKLFALIEVSALAYSAYLARTPLADVKLGALEEIAAVVKRAEDVIGELNDGKREWLMSIPARPDVDPDILIYDALHRQTLAIRDLRICAASLQERIAALTAEKTVSLAGQRNRFAIAAIREALTQAVRFGGQNAKMHCGDVLGLLDKVNAGAMDDSLGQRGDLVSGPIPVLDKMESAARTPPVPEDTKNG